MDIDHFKCLDCATDIPGYLTRRKEFVCPHCNVSYQSNYGSALMHGLYLAFAVWLLGIALGLYFVDAWQKVAALGIELGIPGGVLITYFYHKWSVRVTRR